MFTQPITLTAFSSVPTVAMLTGRIGVREPGPSELHRGVGSQNEEPPGARRDVRQPVDSLEISPEGDAESRRIEAMQRANEGNQANHPGETEQTDQTEEPDRAETEQTDQTEEPDRAETSHKTRPTDQPGGLSESELSMIAELKTRDAEVRAHESAHKAVGGSYAGSVSYSYQTGPDGNRYAVGGSVGIDTSKASTPEATIAKARQVRAAALAPADPSSQDLQVAAAASQMESAARAEKAQQAEESEQPDAANEKEESQRDLQS